MCVRRRREEGREASWEKKRAGRKQLACVRRVGGKKGFRREERGLGTEGREGKGDQMGFGEGRKKFGIRVLGEKKKVV